MWNSGNGYRSGHVRVFNNALLSITTNTFGPQFKVYPNPSFENTKIELGNFYEEVEVMVFDLFGREMMSKIYRNSDKIIVSTQKFTTGVYIVKVESNTNKASLKLIVK